MWGLGFLTKNIGSLREAVHPLYVACAQIWGHNHDWVVPLIKAREQRISVCFPLHYPGFIDFRFILFNPFTTLSFVFQVLMGHLKDHRQYSPI
jgi:hypothetical protein